MKIARLLIWTAMLVLSFSVRSDARDFENLLGDLSTSSRIKAEAASAAFMRANTPLRRSANMLGWDCQAALALANLKMEGGRRKLAEIGDRLVESAVASKSIGTPIGWTSTREKFQACTPRSDARPASSQRQVCNGDATVYGFQSGVAIACLAEAGARLGRNDFVEAASDAMEYWSSQTLPVPGCASCRYFASSDSSEHDLGYVRNMNIYMALGAAALASVTGSVFLQKMAIETVRADQWERRTGNRGYLGRLNPIWQTRPNDFERIENHAAGMAQALLSLSRDLSDPDIKRHAVKVYLDWAECANQACRTGGCGYWSADPDRCQTTATSVHCAFRRLNAAAARRCDTYLENVPRLNSYALWAVLQGGREE